MFQYLFRLWFDDGKLKEEGCVEHYISLFLIRENPLVLTSTYTWPAVDGFLCRTTTILVIANNTTKQSIVGCWDIVMVV